ncbi:MAG TPA: sugar transferase [Puia sp.]|jgi:lipopolysaccharide/colanic/teichoic acid biosynthesis glycosyltransferase|nr:sugar transferase [Puia sp.]
MDFTFLPKTTYKGKAFVRYSIRAKEVSASPLVIQNGFYYIGKNPANIEKLVKLFKRGYASDSIDNARAELKRSIEQEKNTIPEVIFCESSFEFSAVKSFVQFLNSNPAFTAIPFIMDSTHLCDIEMNLYKKHMLADDIIQIESAEQNALFSKVRFLNKVKAKAEEMKSSLKEDEALVVPTINIHSILKRSFDILVSLTALLLLSPLFLFIALAIRIESKGPIFYISKRAGRGYRIFNFYKFRTMFAGADLRIQEFSHLNQYAEGSAPKNPSFFKINNDPRVTRVGAFLRNSSLDELPQLLNVLLGDMSLVGNRPLPLYEAATLTTDQCAQRFLAPAGITGLWQIKKRGHEDMSAEERINLDIDYANKYNFMYDLWIMANTPSALIQKSSA